jgi:hypothetical protein
MANTNERPDEQCADRNLPNSHLSHFSRRVLRMDVGMDKRCLCVILPLHATPAKRLVQGRRPIVGAVQLVHHRNIYSACRRRLRKYSRHCVKNW